MDQALTSADYESLAEVRYQIRRYLRFSEQASQDAGLEPRQYQLLLALKGLPKKIRPRVGEMAERLQIRHHSTVELVNRLVAGGYVRRQRAGEDRREVLVTLTDKGEKVLRKLFLHHLTEIRTRGPALISALKRAIRQSQGSSNRGKTSVSSNRKSKNSKNG